jgi:hypothetical protein
MKWIVGTAALALAFLTPPASAQQSTKPDVSTAPSVSNSGADAPASKNDPATRSEETTGSTAEPNNKLQRQDPANTQGSPGNRTGPAFQHPERH